METTAELWGETMELIDSYEQGEADCMVTHCLYKGENCGVFRIHDNDAGEDYFNRKFSDFETAKAFYDKSVSEAKAYDLLD